MFNELAIALDKEAQQQELRRFTSQIHHFNSLLHHEKVLIEAAFIGGWNTAAMRAIKALEEYNAEA